MRNALRPGHLICAGALGAALVAVAGDTAPGSAEPAPPATPREFYNAGTRNLKLGKLREAEPLLESALASQQEWLWPMALYNLGHVRFLEGAEELKKAPPGGATLAAGQAASRRADEAIGSAVEALAGDDLQRMVEAYLRGRGQRRELQAAIRSVRLALEAFGATLNKWQRADGDFRSACELSPAADDARHNAEVVDRCIAKLVDMLQQLRQLANAMAQQMSELREKLKQLKGRIPAPNMPPGAAGEDQDDDEDQPLGPQPGQKEGPANEGEPLSLSPEQAAWLLDGFRLDAQRRLPMGQEQQAEPRNRNRPTW
jgi:tetratricopeptide (TPR) repeat protein